MIAFGTIYSCVIVKLGQSALNHLYDLSVGLVTDCRLLHQCFSHTMLGQLKTTSELHQKIKQDRKLAFWWKLAHFHQKLINPKPLNNGLHPTAANI